jgi:Tfp pilus assembly protein PilO
MATRDTSTQWRGLVERLHDPVQLKVALTALMLALGYVAVYMPFSAQIAEISREFKQEQRQAGLTHEIEALQNEVDSFADRLPQKTDTNEWVQYVLGGVRQRPLKLVSLDPESTPNVGPYQALVLKIELEGDYGDLNAFLQWMATNQRLFRVNHMKIAPARDESGILNMQLTVMGVMG